MYDETLVDAIYEAAAIPELWPGVLDKLAALMGARGGNILYARPGGQEMRASSPGIEQITLEFEAQGWGARNSRLDRYLARPPHAGFLTDSDLHSEEELRTLPIYSEFLIPHGAAAGAATLIRGAVDDTLAITLEGFADHADSREAIPALDSLRPHLARAATLSGRLAMERVLVAVEALAMIGTPAAMLDAQGRLLTANKLFEPALGKSVLDLRSRLKLNDARSDKRFGEAVARLLAKHEGSSIAIDLGPRRVAMHLLPVRGSAKDIFSSAAALLVLSDAADGRLPQHDLLQALFDLTPSEARIAREIAQGSGVTAVATAAGLSRETVRSHLKTIFEKTNTRRQSELAMLLPRYGLPISENADD
ncbi:helix-turn-helix transcriptional regulator [Sphingomonas sp. YL-JM2C]